MAAIQTREGRAIFNDGATTQQHSVVRRLLQKFLAR
jgi:hypothetical protein